ncbi:MAG: peptide ABC transporter substrate-binding protein [Phycisphaerae bacterium]|nr:peptide ABC transporter substrate-binding protein [Gemmatimonadaceae bacterium]
MKRLRQSSAVCLLALSAACGSDDPPSDANAGATGGTLIVAEPTDVRTLYPPMANRAFDLAVIHSIYNRLAEIGDDLNTLSDSGYTPSLAEGWDWATDSLSIAFRIHPKARWHDGQPVRAEDVRFTFRAYTDTVGLSLNGGYLSNIDSVSVRDSLTPVVWFKRRTPQQFFDATYHMYVLPAHRLSGVPIAELGQDSLSRSPVGSGRFRFVRREENQRIEMESDTSNFRGRASLDRVTWEVSGNLQGATLSVFGGNSDFFEKLQPEDLAQAAKAPDLKIVPYLQAGYSFMSFNLKANGDSTKPHPIFDDVRVRRALSMAVDRVASAQAVLDSFAVPSFGPSPRMMFRNSESLKQVQFDVAHAKALLDSAGWTLAPGQTVRSKGGVPLSFDILVPNTSKPRMTYGTLLADQFRGIGVTATPRNAETRVLGPAVEGGKFDAYIGGLTVTPGLNAVAGSWGTAGVHGLNYGWYSNPRFDATLDSALAEFTPAKSSALWVRAYQIILDDAPAIWLYEERNIGVMHRRIRPAVMRSDAWYANLAEWTVNPSERISRDNQRGRAR